MFTSSDLIVTLIVGIGFGLVAGVVATCVLVVDPLRRERQVFRSRIVAEQMRTYAAAARLTAHRMLRESENDQHYRMLRDTGTHSRKVPDLKAVR